MAEVMDEDVDFFLKIPFLPLPTSSSAMAGGESRYASSSTVTRL